MSSDMHDLHDLLSRMADELDNYRQLLTDDRREVHALATEARAALAAAPESAVKQSLTTAPPAPEPGELVAWLVVGEMVRQLRTKAATEKANRCHYSAALLTRAADLLQQDQGSVKSAPSLTIAPAPVAVPVAERLPGEGDCDAEGRCWLLTLEDEYPQWRLHSVEGHQPGGRMIWVPVDRTPGVMVDAFYVSHWLPAPALPLPAPQGGEVQP